MTDPVVNVLRRPIPPCPKYWVRISRLARGFTYASWVLAACPAAYSVAAAAHGEVGGAATSLASAAFIAAQPILPLAMYRDFERDRLRGLEAERLHRVEMERLNRRAGVIR